MNNTDQGEQVADTGGHQKKTRDMGELRVMVPVEAVKAPLIGPTTFWVLAHPKKIQHKDMAAAHKWARDNSLDRYQLARHCGSFKIEMKATTTRVDD